MYLNYRRALTFRKKISRRFILQKQPMLLQYEIQRWLDDFDGIIINESSTYWS